MNDAIKEAFLIIGVLVFVFLGWQLIFNGGGVVETAYNALARYTNTVYQDSRDGASVLTEYNSGTMQDSTTFSKADFDQSVKFN